jgi:hypothetical protein
MAFSQQGGGLVQRGVPAEATAENAVVARERAIASAQRIAYERMAADIGLNPSASPSQIDSMVESLVVEQERSTRNGYSGRFTVRFNANRVPGARAAMAASGAGAPTGGAVPPPSSGGATSAPTPGTQPILPHTAYLDASTQFGSFGEWLALRQRLVAHPSVGSVDILAISTEGARLRLGLRSPPAVAAGELASGGIFLVPAQPPSATGLPSSTTGPGWRVGLAGGA